MPDADPSLNADRSPALSPFELLLSLWRRKFLVAFLTVACIAISTGLSYRSTKQYSASSQVLFRDPGFAQALFGNSLFDPGQDPQRAAQTNVDVLSSPSVAEEARRILRTNTSATALRDAISIEPNSDADIATITATTASPTLSADLANAYADGYVAYRQRTDRQTIEAAAETLRRAQATASPARQAELESSITNLETLATLQTGNAEVIAHAVPDDDPVAPNPRRAALFGGIVGLLLGCGLALLADRLDRRVKSVEEAEAAYPDYAVIGVVPRGPGRSDEPTLEGPVGEAHRMVREGVNFLDAGERPRCYVVTSADENEGKSEVALNLAASLAAVGEQVTLVDANMRRPSTHAALGLGREAVGLSYLLVSDEHAEPHLVSFPQMPSLAVLPSGTMPPNPADLLRDGRMGPLLAELREISDVVIVDAPPLLPVADTRVLLKLPEIDSVLMVARVGTTTRDQALEAHRILRQSARHVLGVVVTDAPRAQSSGYYGSRARRRLLGAVR